MTMIMSNAILMVTPYCKCAITDQVAWFIIAWSGVQTSAIVYKVQFLSSECDIRPQVVDESKLGIN